MPKLICKQVTFHSENDELIFFEWIARIKCIKHWESVADEIHLFLPKSAVSATCLRELTALFFRYKINMRQLQQFVNVGNKQWYMNENAYWYENVFGNSATKCK